MMLLGGRARMAIEDLELESRPPLTVEEFEALARAEDWDEDTRVELLDGEVVWMSPISDPHAACVKRLNRLFGQCYTADQMLVSVQDPIRIERYDEPQPDVALLRPRPHRPMSCSWLRSRTPRSATIWGGRRASTPVAE
jgi:Uma2 family endonuclease